MGMRETLKKYAVSAELIKESSGGELSNTFYHTCMFCEKLVKVSPHNFESCRNLGGGKFYCPFCLRNNFHYRSSKNVLILSYRGIFGQYYQKNYMELEPDAPQRLWISDIKRMISNHEIIGNRCPVFSYDPTTFLWFVDFNKVGSDSRKAPFREVQSAAVAILACFNLSKIYNQYALEDMWSKFEKSLTLFYEKRQRPDGRRMLIPTLHGVAQVALGQSSRDFIPPMLQLK